MLGNFGIWQAANSWSASVRKRPAPPGCLTERDFNFLGDGLRDAADPYK
jgi:hypothetical protein